MAWTYSNWITFTGQARQTQIRLHIQEVSDALTARVQGNSVGYDPTPLQAYLDGLLKREGEINSSLNGSVYSVPTRRRY
jgi:hypothetical protein